MTDTSTIATLSARGALDTTETGAYLGNVAPATLKKWRAQGTGPDYVKVGTRVVYRVEDLDKWLRDNRVSA